MRAAAVFPVLVLLAGCAHDGGCAPGLAPMREVRLFFGGDVAAPAWNDFLVRDVTPRFPGGFTVLDAQGQWREPGGAIAREKSRVLLIILPDARADGAPDAVRAAYKTRFQQQSVLRADNAVCAAF